MQSSSCNSSNGSSGSSHGSNNSSVLVTVVVEAMMVVVVQLQSVGVPIVVLVIIYVDPKGKTHQNSIYLCLEASQIALFLHLRGSWHLLELR